MERVQIHKDSGYYRYSHSLISDIPRYKAYQRDQSPAACQGYPSADRFLPDLCFPEFADHALSAEALLPVGLPGDNNSIPAGAQAYT